ncbi:hypothetical protein PR048_033291 [Dryococelus australis]|uniref:Uncharacterized protein n=1 Tax=Dryococelus australis TaxID=614101 RepID=A0ABQ9G417_9NEOP|nr:hypothetical protein PR048_033291 [Dryococelus australis]
MRVVETDYFCCDGTHSTDHQHTAAGMTATRQMRSRRLATHLPLSPVSRHDNETPATFPSPPAGSLFRESANVGYSGRDAPRRDNRKEVVKVRQTVEVVEKHKRPGKKEYKGGGEWGIIPRGASPCKTSIVLAPRLPRPYRTPPPPDENITGGPRRLDKRGTVLQISLHAVRREHCTSVQRLALSGDGALDARSSVVLIASAHADRSCRIRKNILGTTRTLSETRHLEKILGDGLGPLKHRPQLDCRQSLAEAIWLSAEAKSSAEAKPSAEAKSTAVRGGRRRTRCSRCGWTRGRETLRVKAAVREGARRTLDHCGLIWDQVSARPPLQSEAIVSRDWRKFTKPGYNATVPILSCRNVVESATTHRKRAPAFFLMISEQVLVTAVAGRLARSPPTEANRAQPPGRVTGLSQVGIVPDDAVGRRVFSGISRFPRPFIPAAAPYSLRPPSSARKTSLLRAVQIPSLTHSNQIDDAPLPLPFSCVLSGHLDRSCLYPSVGVEHLCPVAPSWFEIRSEIGSKIDTENCCTIRVQSWTGDRDEVHFEPLKLADGNTARLARRSDEALGVRVSVARIAPSLLVPWDAHLHLTPKGRSIGATVAERLARSPPTKANWVQCPAGSPDFRKLESCRTMPLVGGSSRGSPVSPAPSFRRRFIFTSITLIGSQNLAAKSLPNLFNHSQHLYRSSQTRDSHVGQPELDSQFSQPEFGFPGFSEVAAEDCWVCSLIKDLADSFPIPEHTIVWSCRFGNVASGMPESEFSAMTSQARPAAMSVRHIGRRPNRGSHTPPLNHAPHTNVPSPPLSPFPLTIQPPSPSSSLPLTSLTTLNHHPLTFPLPPDHPHNPLSTTRHLESLCGSHSAKVRLSRKVWCSVDISAEDGRRWRLRKGVCSNELSTDVRSLVVNRSAGRRTDPTGCCKSCVRNGLRSEREETYLEEREREVRCPGREDALREPRRRAVLGGIRGEEGCDEWDIEKGGGSSGMRSAGTGGCERTTPGGFGRPRHVETQRDAFLTHNLLHLSISLPPDRTDIPTDQGSGPLAGSLHRFASALPPDALWRAAQGTFTIPAGKYFTDTTQPHPAPAILSVLSTRFSLAQGAAQVLANTAASHHPWLSAESECDTTQVRAGGSQDVAVNGREKSRPFTSLKQVEQFF